MLFKYPLNVLHRDKGVFEGGTNWQVFGSRKPLNEAYEVKYMYEVAKDEDEFIKFHIGGHSGNITELAQIEIENVLNLYRND